MDLLVKKIQLEKHRALLFNYSYASSALLPKC